MPPGFSGSRSPVVCEGGVRSDKYVVLDTSAVPQLNAALNCDPVAYCYVTLDEHMGTDIAVVTDSGLRENDAKLPDPGARSNACSLCLRPRMDLFPL